MARHKRAIYFLGGGVCASIILLLAGCGGGGSTTTATFAINPTSLDASGEPLACAIAAFNITVNNNEGTFQYGTQSQPLDPPLPLSEQITFSGVDTGQVVYSASDLTCMEGDGTIVTIAPVFSPSSPLNMTTAGVTVTLTYQLPTTLQLKTLQWTTQTTQTLKNNTWDNYQFN